MTTPTLKTERLVLRQLEESDAIALHSVYTDPDTMRYWSRAPHSEFAETEAVVARHEEQHGSFSCWAITETGDVALGRVNLGVKRDGVAEIGYILRRDHWGKGYSREAVGAVIQFGFTRLHLRRIFADTDPDNRASVALLTSLGFRLEGHLRAEWQTHIGVRDSLIFGLLANEWGKSLP